MKTEKKDQKMSATPSPSKRKRAGPPKCSYCKGVGHRERIFGKNTCPKKKRDSLLLTTTTTATAGKAPNIQLCTTVSKIVELGTGDQIEDNIVTQTIDSNELIVEQKSNYNLIEWEDNDSE